MAQKTIKSARFNPAPLALFLLILGLGIWTMTREPVALRTKDANSSVRTIYQLSELRHIVYLQGPAEIWSPDYHLTLPELKSEDGGPGGQVFPGGEHAKLYGGTYTVELRGRSGFGADTQNDVVKEFTVVVAEPNRPTQ
jgi:hypothetical protein